MPLRSMYQLEQPPVFHTVPCSCSWVVFPPWDATYTLLVASYRTGWADAKTKPPSRPTTVNATIISHRLRRASRY